MTNEEILIAQILTDSKVFYSARVQEQHFGDPMCREAWKILSKLFADGVTPDLSSVTTARPVPPVSWWADKSGFPSTANFQFYEDLVIEAYRMRELRTLQLEIEDWKKSKDSAEILENIDSRLLEITALSDTDRIYKAEELSMNFIMRLEERYKLGGALPGLSTGIPELDDYTLGLQPRLKYEIGGRPSDGKSALMITLICNMAVKNGTRCGVLSLESSKEELYSRIISNIANVNSQNIQSGMIGKASAFKTISDTNAKVYDSPIWIYDVPNMSLSDVKIQARRMVRQHKVEVLFIDYEQMVTIPGIHKKLDRATDVSMAIKNLARELNIPIVAIAQLRRDAEGRRPSLGDFSDSSQIEKDADGAILIYHKREKDPDGNMTKNIESSYLLIEKMRDGRTGSIPVHFEGQYVRFTAKKY